MVPNMDKMMAREFYAGLAALKQQVEAQTKGAFSPMVQLMAGWATTGGLGLARRGRIRTLGDQIRPLAARTARKWSRPSRLAR